MIRRYSPITHPKYVRAIPNPFARHAGAEQDIIDTSIGVLFAVIMRPGDFPGFFRSIRITVTLTFRWPSIQQLAPASANDCLRRWGIPGIVEIAENNQVHVRIKLKTGIDLFAQEFRFFQTDLDLIGLRDRTL